MSFLGQLYQQVYDRICGSHPGYYPWHFQWLFLRSALKWQRLQMAEMKGRVLDVGCGGKPYATWLSPGVTEYLGIDVEAGEAVDVVVASDRPWPFQPDCFDAVLCTQVLEHVPDRAMLIAEISRVLKPGGRLVLTVPFLYPEHGQPFDFARFTQAQIRDFFAPDFEIIDLQAAGGAGTVIATLLLTWIENAMNGSIASRMIKGVILPAWILFSFAVNLLGLVMDSLDRTGTHYANVCLAGLRRT